ncbi:MAG: aspartate/glutamate racemase family protein, partial [Pseudomonadota bacterium]|nr:aspartate/glutamate racemase family protein [Pseudomonadota bacterium]
MRILLINPNTSLEVTERVAAHARAAAGEGIELVPATGRFGARYISTRAAAAIAAHATLDAFAEHGDGCDAVFLACFGDPGLDALRELSPVPVVGMADASCALACMLGRRFSIITGGLLWKPMLEEFVAHIDLTGRLASVRTVASTGGDIARDPEGSLAVLAAESRAAVQADGADVIVLGGAGLAGLAARIANEVPAPVLCSVEAGIRAAIAAGSLHHRKAEQGSFAAPPPVLSSGLSAHLAMA